MAKSTSIFVVSLFVIIAAAQDKLPTIRTGLDVISLEVDGTSRRWPLGQAGNTNILNLDIPEGRPRTVKYTTDVDSITFTVEGDSTYNFTIEKDGVSYLQKIVGRRLDPNQFKMKRFSSGNAHDVLPKLFGPVLDLDGGSKNLEGFQPTIDKVRGCTDCSSKVDVVVISTTAFDTTNPFSNSAALERVRKQTAEFYLNSISKMTGVDSVELLHFTDSAAANTEEAAKAIKSAEIVFIDGGRQCDYLKAFRGTRVEELIEMVYARGGGVGGSSGGQAILGEFIFDGCNSATSPTTSARALADPYDKSVSFSYDFFRWRHLEDTILDQLFVGRDRMGRSLVFVARQIQDGKANRAFAIGVDGEAAVILDKKGMANVVGKGNAYFVTADHKPEVCEPGRPLTYSDFKVWKVTPGGTFNLRKRPTTGYYTVSVTEGKLSRDPY
ncbi:MAG TPA: hypothetical protein VJ023_17275 [Pyrinomonadaceae bacterium]|nr:hypothetical protein [Pyrinomonadaceae bacterium]